MGLANEGGGRLILGVTDKRPRRVVGSLAFPQPEQTRKSLCQKIPLGIDFEEIHHPDCSPGSRVLVFRVPPRPVGIPIKVDGRYWMARKTAWLNYPKNGFETSSPRAGMTSRRIFAPVQPWPISTPTPSRCSVSAGSPRPVGPRTRRC